MSTQNTQKESARTMLKILTEKDYILFTDRCNTSIKNVLLAAKQDGREMCLFQEEGGWLTYEKYIDQADLSPVKMITNDGLIYPVELDNYGMADGVLLLNSMAGYVALQNVDDINTRCITNDILFINDVSGSIGTSEAKIGDVIVGSFGKAKPVNVGTGGFIATNNKEFFERVSSLLDNDEPTFDYALLVKKLQGLEARRQFLLDRATEVKQDLKDKPVVHPDGRGFNVIVRYDTDAEKEDLISYCQEHDLEFTECPREIRILDEAISIEVKRLEN